MNCADTTPCLARLNSPRTATAVGSRADPSGSGPRQGLAHRTSPNGFLFHTRCTDDSVQSGGGRGRYFRAVACCNVAHYFGRRPRAENSARETRVGNVKRQIVRGWHAGASAPIFCLDPAMHGALIVCKAIVASIVIVALIEAAGNEYGQFNQPIYDSANPASVSLNLADDCSIQPRSRAYLTPAR